MKLDFPTFGKPHKMIVLVLGSIEGNLDMCWRTCSRYCRLFAWRFMIVTILEKHSSFRFETDALIIFYEFIEQHDKFYRPA
jgi:hypothetical protein